MKTRNRESHSLILAVAVESSERKHVARTSPLVSRVMRYSENRFVSLIKVRKHSCNIWMAEGSTGRAPAYERLVLLKKDDIRTTLTALDNKGLFALLVSARAHMHVLQGPRMFSISYETRKTKNVIIVFHVTNVIRILIFFN